MKLTFAGLWLLTLMFTTGTVAAPPERPNFVVFLTDDQPYGGLSCTGNTVLKTPNMDRIASQGVLFEKAFVTTSICCTSRASILTGQHMRRHGIDDFAKPLSAEQWRQTFPALLHQAGYRTAFLGKYAVGAPNVNKTLALPEKQFDLWYGFPQSIAFKQVIEGRDRYLTTVIEEKAEQFLEQPKGAKPFCMIVALKEPHGPLTFFDPEFKNQYANVNIPRPVNLTRESFGALPQAVREGLNDNHRWLDDPAKFQAETRREYAYISRADLAVGRIRQLLKEQGLDQNTVVLFLSDNGLMDGAHGLGGKWLMYEESIQIPLMIYDPRLPASTQGRRSQMALNIDIAPTILAMAGVPVPDNMQGQDLQPMLLDPHANGREDWYYEHVYTTNDGRKSIPKSEGIRTNQWKYVRYTEFQPPLEQLFNLSDDPLEERNLAAAPVHAATLLDLRRRCDESRISLR